MRKLTFTIAIPLLLGLVGVRASAADGETKKGDAATRLKEYFERKVDPEAAVLPENRRAEVNLQSQGQPSFVPISWDGTTPQGESTYLQGHLERIEDGGLHIAFDVTDPKTGAKSKVTRWYRLASLKAFSKSVLDSKVGSQVRLEMKKDAHGVPFVMSVLAPR